MARREHNTAAVMRFREEMHPAPPFAILSRGDLRLLLSAPNPMGGGGQSMPDGRTPEPGGWNRISLEVTQLDVLVERLRSSGVHFWERHSERGWRTADPP
jgi:hypothetical protein